MSNAQSRTTGSQDVGVTGQAPVRSAKGAIRRARRAYRRAEWMEANGRPTDARRALAEGYAYVTVASKFGTTTGTPKVVKPKTGERRLKRKAKLVGFCRMSSEGTLVGAAKASHDRKMARIACELNEPIRSSIVRERGTDEAIMHPRERGRVREVTTLATARRLRRYGIAI